MTVNQNGPADGASYQGLATFGQLPWVTEPDELTTRGVDVAIVGAPWDGSTTNRPAIAQIDNRNRKELHWGKLRSRRGHGRVPQKEPIRKLRG